MTTTIELLSEKAAMVRVGTRSINCWVYAVTGDRVREVVDWVDGKSLPMQMVVHWDGGRILAAYLMFGRVAYSHDRLQNINSALTLFQLAWKQAEGFQWLVGEAPKATKAL
ncbi:hypothetical protein MCBMB27_05610 [Methylobacterium phyllosphaerae]|uniref:Uncharacterized protein n=1 Tax=Methylobacterium phyllosphaerae TaxID=418223 RepID=A0AAE8HVA3_9HYPH|nr:hypothetical protein [Methylobacterium phyllosphaerae]APT34901.1 hypothetical protein MCBMB27_05610 [Methylobacterium phyllosphaerae]SFH36287.1 hypothetical protein SAMN05192567_121111 [Methylobacterium phyllosphaerae]